MSLPASWDTKIAARATAPTNKEAKQSKRAPSHLPLAITIMYAWLWTSWCLKGRVFITISFNNGVIFQLTVENKPHFISFVLFCFVIGPANLRKTNRLLVVCVYPRSTSSPCFLRPLSLLVIFSFVLIGLLLLNCTLDLDQCLLWPDNVMKPFSKFHPTPILSKLNVF